MSLQAISMPLPNSQGSSMQGAQISQALQSSQESSGSPSMISQGNPMGGNVASSNVSGGMGGSRSGANVDSIPNSMDISLSGSSQTSTNASSTSNYVSSSSSASHSAHLSSTASHSNSLSADGSVLKKLNNSNIEYKIIDVWESNFDEEIEKILQIVEHFPYIAMDTEFPGVVARPVDAFKSHSEYYYQSLRCNVNLLKIIQLGVTFCDKDGNVPDQGRCIWQFNFKFDMQKDMFAQDSIQLLIDSGINFNKHSTEGIDVQFFAEKIMCSGIVLSDDVEWISFHSAYDFGYLIRLLTATDLPASEKEFFRLLKIYFPHVYDVKYMMKGCENLKGGLNQLGEDLNVKRVGPAHQAGSDSLLTLHTFFAIIEQCFDNKLDREKYDGILYGLSGDTLGSHAPKCYNSPPPINQTPKK